MNTNGQARAKAGGEIGINGEFYEGGKFLPSNEDRPKTAPGLHSTLSAEALAEIEARRAREAAEAARVREWLGRRVLRFADLIKALCAQPVGNELSPERWADAVANGAAGFLPSLGRQLATSGSLSPRQAEFATKAFIGRRVKANAAEWDTMVEGLTESFE